MSNSEPSNKALMELIHATHKATTERFDRQDSRLDVLEHHIVDPKKPERTLPVRVRELEKAHRLVKVAGGAVGGSVLAALGSWIWAKWSGGGTH